jgi:23S rRNA (guanosine2251-2'-O)-methyltransferase
MKHSRHKPFPNKDSRPFARTKPHAKPVPHTDRRPERQRQTKSVPQNTANPNGMLIWGLHAVRAAWLNPKRRCFRLWLTEAGEKAMARPREDAHDLLLKRPDAKRVERFELDRLVPPGSVHQGVVLEAAPLHEPSLHDIIAGDNPPDLLIMLDQATDPHNVGAILRSAAAFGAGAVIMTERNAPGLTGVLAKAASGATEHVPQIHVVNLARVLDELQEAGYWRVGLAEEGAKELSALDLSGRTVLVLGAEGEGLRQLTRKKCDELAKLPTSGPIGSLNVSNAAAVGLYEARRQKTPFA